MTFSPDPKDNVELGLYFGAGQNPSTKWTQPAQRDRRERVERALDGRGYALQRYYRGGLAAVSADREWAVLVLGREYRAYLEIAHQRGRPRRREPHVVLPEAQVERLITRPLPSKFTTELVDGRWVQRPEEDDPDFAQIETIAGLLDAGVVERSTWGDLRVSPAGARRILLAQHWLDGERQLAHVRALDDSPALAALRGRVAALPEVPVEEVYEPPANRTATATERENLRRALCAVGANPAVVADPRSIERGEWDSAATTVTELADKYRIRRQWVRDELVRLGCPGASVRRSPVPTAWLASELGAEFRAAAAIEHARMAPILRATRARRLARPSELFSPRHSLEQLNSCRP